jgi:hypothetical protein
MRRLALAAAIGFTALVACGTGAAPEAGTSPEAIFVVPAAPDGLEGTAFFDHPWPSDLRRAEDGTVVFTGWPNPTAKPLLEEFLRATEGLLDGFSPTAAIYFRFTSPIDPQTLPADPSASTSADSSVQLVDVDPDSPERGTRRVVMAHWHETSAVDDASYWPEHTLAIMPVLGQPLRPKTRYAAVVTSRLRGPGGAAVKRSPGLGEALGEAPATEGTARLRELFAPAVTELEAVGIAREEVVHMTVFTTNDPTEETFRVADDVFRSVPAPTARDLTLATEGAEMDVYEGTYGPSPNYQAGRVPYSKPKDGGAFVFDGGGPVLQGTFDQRFALAVPNAAACPPPPSGYPIVLYAHGTGGDYRSFVRDGTASALAGQCLASMGVDQILHGTRPGAPALDDPQRDQTIELLFFNFDNPSAARTNNRQSAIDVVQQARLFTETRQAIPANVSRTGGEIAFDGTRVLFFGHSQGGLNGPLFLAASNQARGGVLSGAGSVLAVALLEKSKPVDIPAAVRFLLGVPADAQAELNLFHPAITLAQSIVDVTDPIHYGAFITRTPRPGHAPKSILQTEGIAADGTGDTYSPPRGIEALGVSMGLPRIAPGVRTIEEATWARLEDLVLSAEGTSGNIGGGAASGAFAQYAPAGGRDGHFVVFHVPEARSQTSKFLRHLADDPRGRVSLP